MEKLRLWFKKKTTPVHILVGLLAASFLPIFWPMSLAIILLFALDERWDDQCQKANDPNYILDGEPDWWEAFCPYLIGCAIIGLLVWLGTVTIRFW